MKINQHTGFSQTRNIGNIGIIANFVFPFICSLLPYLHHMILVNVKLDVSAYMKITFQDWRLHWSCSFLMAQLKQSWQYWHSGVVESLWKTLLKLAADLIYILTSHVAYLCYSITSFYHPFGCPIICTDTYLQCYFGDWHLQQSIEVELSWKVFKSTLDLCPYNVIVVWRIVSYLHTISTAGNTCGNRCLITKEIAAKSQS